MPTYDYKCDACGTTFEKFQSMTAPAIKNCPSCKKRKVRRLIGTGAGLIFKGSGFYITDYRDAGYKDAAKKDSGSPETKPDAKPAEGNAKPPETKAPEPKPAPESKTTPPPPTPKSSKKK